MKEFALFIGCNIPAKIPQYDISARAVLKKLDIKVQDNKDFNCCGYPARNTDQIVWLLSAARNIALAEKSGLDMLVLCNCCFGSLKNADALLKKDSTLKDKINGILTEEGLEYTGDCTISHFLSVLHNDITVQEIKKKMVEFYKDLKIATHYGCHLLRPSDVMEFDDPVSPSIFDDLVQVTGAKSIDWPSKLDCCGAPVLGINDSLSYDLTKTKLLNAKNAGADFICVTCPWCHMQFDKIQNQIPLERDKAHKLPSILYTQLLGLRLGISRETLGIDTNHESQTFYKAYSKLFETVAEQEKPKKKKKAEKKATGKKAEKKAKTVA